MPHDETLPSDSIPVDLLVADRLWSGALWLPFDSARHPATETVAAETAGWLKQHGLLRPSNARAFERARFTELAGRVYHRFDAPGLRLASDFISALFVLDDLMDDAAAGRGIDVRGVACSLEAIRLSAHTGRPHPSSTPWIAEVGGALADLTRRLVAMGCETTDYLREVDRYLDGVLAESATRVRSARHSSVSEYAEARVAFSAVYACVELGLALLGPDARGRTLRRSGATTASARDLTRLANLSVSWVNDVYSWPKERALGERSNLVVVLSEVEGRSERDALTRACELCDQIARDFCGLREGHDPATVGLLEAWMRGNADWHHLGTDRYRDQLSVVPHAA
jgi:hypothetical protein